MARGRDGADIPDNRPLLVETGSPDQQQTPLAVFARDIAEHLLIGITRDKLKQRCRIGQRFAENPPKQPPLLRNVGWRYASIHRTQTIAVGAPKESERSDHRAGADARHQFKRWHRATIGPAAEQSGAEC